MVEDRQNFILRLLGWSQTRKSQFCDHWDILLTAKKIRFWAITMAADRKKPLVRLLQHAADKEIRIFRPLGWSKIGKSQFCDHWIVLEGDIYGTCMGKMYNWKNPQNNRLLINIVCCQYSLSLQSSAAQNCDYELVFAKKCVYELMNSAQPAFLCYLKCKAVRNRIFWRQGPQVRFAIAFFGVKARRNGVK